MRLVIVVALFVAITVIATVFIQQPKPKSSLPQPAGPVTLPEPITTPTAKPTASELTGEAWLVPDDSNETAETGVINIGEPMDPDDPSTWPQSENTEVINIGEPMDPDDPSTWPQPENTEVINIGAPMDPDDPSTWPQSQNTEVTNIGEPMDPDDPSTWPR